MVRYNPVKDTNDRWVIERTAPGEPTIYIQGNFWNFAGAQDEALRLTQQNAQKASS